jgi:hypothetical protein
MVDGYRDAIVLTLLLIILFFISQVTIRELFHVLHSVVKKRGVVYGLISLFFFPGTVLHELSHFLMATVLMLRVREVSVLPEWEGDNIKLGKLRGIIVGVAPLIAGLLFFLVLASWYPLLKGNVMHAAMFYGIFVVSSTMFSSKQDLNGLVFIIPFAIISGGIVYVLNIPLGELLGNVILSMNSQITLINTYLFYSLIIHLILIALFKGVRSVVR